MVASVSGVGKVSAARAAAVLIGAGATRGLLVVDQEHSERRLGSHGAVPVTPPPMQAWPMGTVMSRLHRGRKILEREVRRLGLERQPGAEPPHRGVRLSPLPRSARASGAVRAALEADDPFASTAAFGMP